MVYAYPDPIERICRNDDEEETKDDWSKATHMSEIQRFYDGASVFVIGGTGFIGMTLVEKLLRTCTGLKNLFLLVRSHKGKTAEEKLREMFRNQLFAQLFETHPKILDKVKLVHGDIEENNLGLSPSDIEMLKREVNIFINVAATVRFDEPLRKAYFVNVVSLKAMIALAESMSNLKVFIHTSTTFCQTDRQWKYVEEKFYPSPYTGFELEAILNSADDYTILCLSDLILDKKPNTYTLTKAMGEEVIRQKLGSLPIAIYRPSIVLNSYKEPLHSWSSTLQGAIALCIGVGLGIVRVLNIAQNKRAEIIPVDKCASALVALPWYIQSKRMRESLAFPIFNHVNDRNPVTWERFFAMTSTHIKLQKTTIKSMVWVFNMNFEGNRFLYNIKVLFLHILPLPIFMLVEKLQKQPSRIRKIYVKMILLVEQLRSFTNENYKFVDFNVQQLWSRMSDHDRHLFHLNVDDLDWNEYARFLTNGTVFYLLKEPVANVSKSVLQKRRVLAFLDKALRYVVKALEVALAYKIGALLYGTIQSCLKHQINRL